MKNTDLYDALDVLVSVNDGNPHRCDDVTIAVDRLVDFILQNPRARLRFDERMRYNYRTPNRYFLSALASLEDNYDVESLLTTIHRQDEDIAFLSHNLARLESYVSKFETMAKKIDWLKCQNKRLVERNKELVERVYQSKDNR